VAAVAAVVVGLDGSDKTNKHIDSLDFAKKQTAIT
jgi:hypothetical protein